MSLTPQTMRHLHAAQKALARVDDQLFAAAQASVGDDQYPADAPGWTRIHAVRESLHPMTADPTAELDALIEWGEGQEEDV